MLRPVRIEPHPFMPPRPSAPPAARPAGLGLALAAGALAGLALMVPALAASDALVTDVALARMTPWGILVVLVLLAVVACSWVDRGVPAQPDDEGAASDDADRGR